jgi:alkylation response protein AidB-like acyl-CoA dehydrogenase
MDPDADGFRRLRLRELAGLPEDGPGCRVAVVLPPPEATRLCAMAKQAATDAGFNAANNALQLFGGYGYLADYGVEKLVRGLRVHQILVGTNEIMRVIVARGLIEN